ncbi:glycosyltransferase [Candidatus Gromoviella agglomerans]|uniref:glycosyltransferase n=1 Tax=Candidatus Gromoviella agglomerans TaxID=2806609 RepID=UPI001E636F2C|nr:glycosyltransferase [Candidatus Gromoviella agglomerans]UFX98137.1 UDP-N-acetylmuramate--L-alanine ligase [Candidatus Gromoviella agglomerans]
MNENKLIVLITGGTGGHVFPAQGIAESLVKDGYDVVILTDFRGYKLLRNFVNSYDIHKFIDENSYIGEGNSNQCENRNEFYIKLINCFENNLSGQIPKNNSGTLHIKVFSDLSGVKGIKRYFHLLSGVLKSKKFLKIHRPCCVVSFGGYASFAPSIAAKMLKIPLLIHQSDVVFGKANMFLSILADVVMTGFDPEITNLNLNFLKFFGMSRKIKNIREKIIWTGVPIRNIFDQYINGIPFFGMNESARKFNILVLGGSQAAKVWSKYLPGAIMLLSDEIKNKIHIKQHCHVSDIDYLKNQYSKMKINHHVDIFIDDIAKDIAISNVVFSRAGASSIAECSYLNKPMLLVPYPFASQNHQCVNAYHLVNHMSSWCIEESQLSSELLSEYIRSFFENAEILSTTGMNLGKIMPNDANDRILKEIKKYNGNDTKCHSKSIAVNNKKESIKVNLLEDPFSLGERDVYILAIGGIGMSAVARALFFAGYRVYGSDINDSKLINELLSEGVIVSVGHNADNIAQSEAKVCIFSSAIKSDNVELCFARQHNMKLLHRAEVLANISCKFRDVITISGTHGKTTTTSLCTMLFYYSGLSFMSMNGGIIQNLKSNFYQNLSLSMSQSYFINEGDESDDSFIKLDSDVAVVTNIELEHMDFHKNENKLKQSFLKFMLNARKAVVVCGNDSNVMDLIHVMSNSRSDEIPLFAENDISNNEDFISQNITEIRRKKVYICLSNLHYVSKFFDIDSDFFAVYDVTLVIASNVKTKNYSTQFDIILYENLKKSIIEKHKFAFYDISDMKSFVESAYDFNTPYEYHSVNLNMVGEHNVMNALMVVSVAHIYNISFDAIQNSLYLFDGTKRRFSILSSLNKKGVTIIDDYAHHPTEITATILAARQINQNRIISIIQPHRFTRLSDNFDAFVASCGYSDVVVILPVYSAGEISGDVNSFDLYKALKNRDVDAFYCENLDALKKTLNDLCKNGDIVLFMGAGSVSNYAASICDMWSITESI